MSTVTLAFDFRELYGGKAFAEQAGRLGMSADEIAAMRLGARILATIASVSDEAFVASTKESDLSKMLWALFGDPSEEKPTPQVALRRLVEMGVAISWRETDTSRYLVLFKSKFDFPNARGGYLS